jgi:hypothetical protein
MRKRSLLSCKASWRAVLEKPPVQSNSPTGNNLCVIQRGAFAASVPQVSDDGYGLVFQRSLQIFSSKCWARAEMAAAF